MKPGTIAVSIILVAFALYASEPQAEPKSAAKPQLALKASTVLPPSEPGNPGDSPLVRAAKAGRRTGMKTSLVITNETLVRTGGHFTTTASQQPIAPVRGPGEKPEEQSMAERPKTASYNAAAAAGSSAAAPDVTPENLYGNEPPPVAGPVQTMKPAGPPTMEPQAKPPV